MIREPRREDDSAPWVVVHDSFVQAGGAERVAAQLSAALDDAPMYTAAFRPGFVPGLLRETGLRTSAVQPLVEHGLPWTAVAPLLPAAFGRLRLGAPEVVVSSSSAFAHHVRVPARTLHLCYCHTPPRFLWEPADYFQGQQARRSVLSPGLALLRRSDLAAARRVDTYVANSRHVAARILRVYGRQAEVVYPPVETDAFRPTTERSGRFLLVSRLRNHKRVDLAIAAAGILDLPLDVIGTGPELETLRRAAGPTVRFLGPRSDDEVRHAMTRCAGLLVPAAQDFGLTMVEAQAAGRPPIAYGEGGAKEIIEDGRTGFLFAEPTPEALGASMERARRTDLDADVLRRSAERFDIAAFRAGIYAAIAAALQRRAIGREHLPAAAATRPMRELVALSSVAQRAERDELWRVD